MGGMTFWGSVNIIPRRLEPNSRTKGEDNHNRNHSTRKREPHHLTQTRKIMRITLDSDTLSKNLQGLSRVIAPKSSIAILDHFLFEVEGDKLTVTASDNENVMKATADILESDIDSGEPTRFCVHARLIADFLKNLPVQPLTFVVEEKEISVRYENGQICFPCVSGKEYPTMEMLTGDCTSATLPSSMLQDDITRTSSFVAQDTMRPVLSALCFNFKENGLDVVSCNGQVLMMDTHRGITLENENRFLLPAKPAALLRYWTAKDLFDITIQFNGNAARFSGANWQLTCRLVEGRYPHYKAVIPVNNDKTLLIDKQQLQVAIRRMLPMGSQSFRRGHAHRSERRAAERYPVAHAVRPSEDDLQGVLQAGAHLPRRVKRRRENHRAAHAGLHRRVDLLR